MGRLKEFIRILDTSFDAGFLVTDRGEILHGNHASQHMFAHMSRSRLGNIHTHLTFLAPKNIDLDLPTTAVPAKKKEFGDIEAISWEEVVNLLLVQQMGMPELIQMEHWEVIGTNKERREFMAKAKLTLLSGTTRDEPYVLVFIRHLTSSASQSNGINSYQKQKQDTTLSTDQKQLGTGLAASAIRHHHHGHHNERQQKLRTEPSFTLNPHGIIIEFNKAALEKVQWCRQELVGHHVSSIQVESSLETSTAELCEKLEGEQSGFRNCKGIIFLPEKTTATPLVSNEKEGENEDKKRNNDNSTVHSSSFTSYPQQIDNIMTAIVEASVDPLFLISERGIIQMVNRAAVQEFGWTRSEMLGENISIIVGGGHGPHHDGYIKQYLKSGVAKVLGKRRELQAKRKDGSEFAMELVAAEVPVFYDEKKGRRGVENDNKVSDDDDQRLFIGFVRNLTDIKAKHRMSMGIIESSHDPTFVINAEGIVRMANDAAARQFGWTREELVGSDIHGIIAPECIHYLFGNQGKKIDMPARRKNGSFFPIQLGMAKLPELNGERLFCETIYDMTQVNRDANLRVGVIEASMSPMFLIDEKATICMVNQAAVELFGWDRKEFLGSNIKMIAGGAHRKYHDGYIQDYIKTGEMKVIGKTRELPARRKDGSEFRIELRVTEVETEYGESRIFCGYIHDLSNIKLKEHIISGILEATKESLFVINKRGTIKMINQLAANHFSWNRDELLETNIGTVAGGEFIGNQERFVTKLLQQVATNSMGKKDIYPGRGKDGEEFQFEIELTQIPGEREFFCGHVQNLSSIIKT